MPKRLLVIDDQPGVCNFVAKVAIDFGFDVTKLHDLSGIDINVLAGFDLLVLDLLMPNTDAIEFLRQCSSEMHFPKLILMSGMGRRTLESARQLAQTKGIDVCDILCKPFGLSELRAIFEKNCIGDTQVQAKASRRAAPVITLDEIATAIKCGELVMHFQPQIMLEDGRWSGVEALVRWQHPVHGLLYPDAFITLVENSELALPFTEAVIRSAIKGVKVLSQTSSFDGDLSVNLPPSALTEVTFPEQLESILAELDFDRKKLILEITETSIAIDPHVAQDIQTRLSMRGIRMSIDDFGTGHSSLERLHGSPFDELKIDIVFVSRADDDLAACAIIQNSIALGHSLQMIVIAEGVETAQTLNWLKSLGCDVAQGYFISRPQPVEALKDWLFAKTQFAEPDAAAPSAGKDSAVMPVSAFDMPPKILVVEDNLENQNMFAEYLGTHGFDVSTADNGEEAVLLSQTHAYALIIMDGQMPLIDGIEATRRIRLLGGANAYVPIIALTALTTLNELNRFKEAGADTILSKPVRLKELLANVYQVLERPASTADNVSTQTGGGT